MYDYPLHNAIRVLQSSFSKAVSGNQNECEQTECLFPRKFVEVKKKGIHSSRYT